MATTLVPFGFSRALSSDFHRELDGLMRKMFSDNEAGSATVWTPRLNVSESEQQYEVSLDLPGMKIEDIDVELRQGELWITGIRHHDQTESGKTWHRVERFHGEFRRVVRLGDDVDAEKVTAEYVDGVLKISVPKAESSKTRKVAITATSRPQVLPAETKSE